MPRFMPVVALASAAFVVAGLARPADAAVLSSGSVPVDDTFVTASCTDAGGTPFDIVQHDVGFESWADKVTGAADSLGAGEIVDVTITRDIASTFTNSVTGRSWTATFRTRIDTLRVLAVSGDEVTVRRAFTGHFVGFAPTGAAIDRQDTRLEFTVVVDTHGTVDPTDDTESFDGVSKAVGRNTVGDICEVALTWTT